MTNEYKEKELLLESLIEVPICGYVDHYLKRMVNQDVYFIETVVKPLALEVVKTITLLILIYIDLFIKIFCFFLFSF